MGIGGNMSAVIQARENAGKSAIGTCEQVWIDKITLRGWLDLSNGDSKYTNFNAKVQESTHIFLCDYQPLPDVESENARMVIQGQIYDILLIDDPMNMNEHLEIYLRFVGGQ